MASGSHKRETNARLPFLRPRPGKSGAVRIAGPVALVATAVAVTGGVFAGEPAANDQLFAGSATADVAGVVASGSPSATATPTPAAPAATAPAGGREAVVTRSAPRTQAAQGPTVSPRDAALSRSATRLAVRNAESQLWTTADLNLWSAPGEGAESLGEIASGERVLVTGRALGEREEIVVDGEAVWVTAGYLSEEEPNTLTGECTNGTSVPSGVSSYIKLVHAAVCANFPSISSYGTFRDDGEHGQGRAIDVMVSGELGWEIAEFLRDNYAALGIEYIIYAQKIWSVERSGEGWRGMENRGSATANHYDHVHVTTH